MKLNNQEKRDLDKYVKFLALKSTQIIIQSRLGEKVSTACKPQVTGTDWFNLNVSDLPEVLADAKKVLSGEILSSRLPLCVEISLRTSDDDQMVLETWCLSLSPEKCDPAPRIIHSIYNKMGVVLKSLVTTTRVVPAYKLSRLQSYDSFIFCYRIYMGEPREQCLGEGYKHTPVGQICSPIGTFQLSVSYRMKLSLSPTQSERNDYIRATHDQLISNSDPTLVKRENHKVDRSKPMKPGALAHPSNVKTLEDFEHLLVPKIPEAFRRCVEDSDEDSNSTEIGYTEQEEKEIESQVDTLKLESSTESNESFIMVRLNLQLSYYDETFEFTKLMVEWRKPKILETFKFSSPDESDFEKQLETFESDWSEHEELVDILSEWKDNY